MKKTTFAFIGVMCATAFSVNAQLVKQSPKQKIYDWHFSAFDKNGVYGAEIDKAYDFLKDKKAKKKPIIAMVGYGLDVEHEDLKNQLWINPNDKPDGLDNDKNGFVDDVNGWNYLGNAKGEVLNKTNKEADREFLRLKSKYAGIWNTGHHYLRFDDKADKPVMVLAPADVAEFNYFRNLILPNSITGAAYNQADLYKFMKYYLFNDFTTAMLKVNPDLSKLDGMDFVKLLPNYTADIDSVKFYAAQLIAVGMTFRMPKMVVTKKTTKADDQTTPPAEQAKAPLMPFDKYKAFFLTKYDQYGKKYQDELAKMNDNRSVVGDDWTTMKQKNYGNNDVFSNSAFYGTTAAGVIAAQRNNNIGVNGIVDGQLMTLKVYPKEGDPFYKDMALAIRYAVDHKADVIVLGMPSLIYPAYEAQWVNEALIYAEQKGVLVIAPVWDASEDMSKIKYYPNRHIAANKDLGNFLTVAASDTTGSPVKTTNFGKTELDLYAPGVNISTTYLGSTYRISSGSLAASSVAAGVAGLLKAYYPNLSGTQLRTLLMKTVTTRPGVEVEKTVKTARKNTNDLYLLTDLSASGGIINAYQAVIAADAMTR